VQRCCQQLHWRNYADCCSDGLRKTTGNVSEDSRPLEQDLYPWLSRAKIRTAAHSTALLSLKHVENKIQKANNKNFETGRFMRRPSCLCLFLSLNNELAETKLGETKLVTNVRNYIRGHPDSVLYNFLQSIKITRETCKLGRRKRQLLAGRKMRMPGSITGKISNFHRGNIFVVS
jgi:hypothetical protein